MRARHRSATRRRCGGERPRFRGLRQRVVASTETANGFAVGRRTPPASLRPPVCWIDMGFLHPRLPHVEPAPARRDALVLAMRSLPRHAPLRAHLVRSREQWRARDLRSPACRLPVRSRLRHCRRRRPRVAGVRSRAWRGRHGRCRRDGLLRGRPRGQCVLCREDWELPGSHRGGKRERTRRGRAMDASPEVKRRGQTSRMIQEGEP